MDTACAFPGPSPAGHPADGRVSVPGPGPAREDVPRPRPETRRAALLPVDAGSTLRPSRTGSGTPFPSSCSAWWGSSSPMLILRLQHLLPLNPQRLGPVSEHLAFNTAVSFTTNTNWQSYGGESTMSYLSQMVALAFHNFVSAAAGIAVAAALVRGIARHTAKTVGNFLVDLVRMTLYLLLPLCLLYAVFLVSQGMIQNFKPYETRPARRADDRGVADHRAGADGLAGGDQDARDQRGRVHQRQRRPPVREPDAAVQFPPDLLDLPDPERPHLLPGTHGEESEARLVGVERDGRPVPGGRPPLLVGGRRGKPPAARAGGGSGRREHGGEGGPLRDLLLRPVRHRDHGRLLRRGELDARFLHAARRVSFR